MNTEELEKSFRDIVAGSREDGEVHTAAAAAARELDASGRPIGSKTPSLDQYCTDLTADAAAGRVDPVLGRDPEIRQIIDILMRRRQNNPILTGEAGVGKTAVVEGFALRIANGDVPEPLKNIALKTLDLGLLQAGAGVKGEFENRLKQVIEEVKNSAQPIILFIDEAHTLIGAGGQEGQNDAANLLKPALARGELRTIAATTWAEYKKYFEKDPALTRRFQPVKVDEPSEDLAVRMMRGLTEKLEEHHGVRILDDAVVDSVRLSHRYIAARQLPDKSVSVLDTSCARVAIGAAATPPAIEDLRRQIDALEVERGIRSREQAAGADHAERLEAAPAGARSGRRDQADPRAAGGEPRAGGNARGFGGRRDFSGAGRSRGSVRRGARGSRRDGRSAGRSSGGRAPGRIRAQEGRTGRAPGRGAVGDARRGRADHRRGDLRLDGDPGGQDGG
jgi:type VI secretion system protein VasG